MKSFVSKLTTGKAGFLIKVLVIALIAYAMFDVIYSDWGTLAQYLAQTNYTLFFISFLPLLLYLLLTVEGWRMVLRGMSHKVGMLEATKIKMVSDIGRYLPGKIWSVVGRTYWCGKIGVSKADAFVSTMIEISMFLLSGVAVFIIFLPFKGLTDIVVIPLAAIVIAAAMFFMQPKILFSAINRILRMMKMKDITASVSRTRLLGLLGYYTALWAVFGVSFYIFINSFYPMPLENMGMLTGVFAFSFVMGFVVLIAPGGLGVREGFMSLLLSAYMPLPLAIAISLFSRVWYMIAEFLIAGVSLLIARRNWKGGTGG